MKHKSFKYALFRSMTALFLCLVMWIGTTYAWLTQTMTTEKNILVSGNMDVELQYAKTDSRITNIEDLEWRTVGPGDELFKEVGWVPSDLDIVYLRVVNKGQIDVMYELNVNLTDEIQGTNTKHEDYWLSQHIYGTVLEYDSLAEMNISSLENFRTYIDASPQAGTSVALDDPDWDTDGVKTLVRAKLEADTEDGNGVQISEPIAVLLGMPTRTTEANYLESKDEDDPLKHMSTFDLSVTLAVTQAIYDGVDGADNHVED